MILVTPAWNPSFPLAPVCVPSSPWAGGMCSSLWEQTVGRAGRGGTWVACSPCCGWAEKTFLFCCPCSGKRTGQSQGVKGTGWCHRHLQVPLASCSVSIILSYTPDATIKHRPPRCVRAAHPCRITRRRGWANVFIIYLLAGPRVLQQNAELHLWELVWDSKDCFYFELLSLKST